MKLKSFIAHHVAGYESVAWTGLQSDLNLLVGRNGAGKSTLLQLISFGLEFLGGRRTEDVLTRTLQGTAAEIEFLFEATSRSEEHVRLNIEQVRIDQGNAHRRYAIKVLQFVENRQPKNVMGLGRSQLRNHPMDRYAHAISELKFLLESNAPEDRELAEETLTLCQRLPVGNQASWQWIRAAVRQRGTKRARPVSCGQFDVVALCLDLVHLRRDLVAEPENERSSVFVVLDNPETYLHPACQVPALELIREIVPDAQMFVASHSLRLLSWPSAKSVFWLSREMASDAARVEVRSVRELDDGARGAFLELYGDDISAAVFRLLTEFQSPTYFRFLCECALPEPPKLRAHPEHDPQLLAVRAALGEYHRSWTVLDFGAGHADLLAALEAWGDTSLDTTYVAMTQHRSALLEERVSRAVATGMISPVSRLIADLASAPTNCDAIVLCNVCHEVTIEELPGLLARLLSGHLKRSPSSRLVIHEVEVLVSGEAGYIMWTSDDYRQVFSSVPALTVESRPFPRATSVPLNTTVIFWTDTVASLDDLQVRLTQGFESQLPLKKRARLREYADVRRQRAQTGFLEAIRQRRIAFLIAEIAALDLAQERRDIAVELAP